MNITTTELPSMRVVTVPHTGPYNQIGGAFRRLAEVAGPAGLFPGAVMLGIFHDDSKTVPAEQLRSAAALTLPADAAVPRGLEELHLPGGRFARYVHHGSYEKLGESWRQLEEAVPKSGYQRRPDASLEIYRNTPATVPPEQLLTELHIPIV